MRCSRWRGGEGFGEGAWRGDSGGLSERGFGRGRWGEEAVDSTRWANQPTRWANHSRSSLRNEMGTDGGVRVEREGGEGWGVAGEGGGEDGHTRGWCHCFRELYKCVGFSAVPHR
jgi:hypothetical protein